MVWQAARALPFVIASQARRATPNFPGSAGSIFCSACWAGRAIRPSGLTDQAYAIVTTAAA